MYVTVEDLLLWRSWEKTAPIVGVATLAYVGVELSGISVISLLSNLLLLLIVVSFIWNNVATFAGRYAVPGTLVLLWGLFAWQLHASIPPLLKL